MICKLQSGLKSAQVELIISAFCLFAQPENRVSLSQMQQILPIYAIFAPLAELVKGIWMIQRCFLQLRGGRNTQLRSIGWHIHNLEGRVPCARLVLEVI